MKFNLKINIVTLLIVSSIAHAQNTSNKILVEYTVQRGITVNKERLIATQDKEFYIMDSLFVEKNDNINVAELDEETNIITINQKVVKIDASKYYLRLDSNVVYFTQKHKGERRIIKDIMPNLEWELVSGESKTINNFVCNKATLNYRGSNLVAYYTNEIPISFGPWKFKGLPGLILEVYNTSEGPTPYHWIANRVLYPYNESINLDYIENKEKEVVNLKDYIFQFDKKMREQMQAISSRAPKGVIAGKSNIKRTGVERVFEWEEK